MFRFFFLILKTPKTTYLSLKRIFVSSGFWVLGRIVGFWWSWIGLTMSLRCFLGILSKK
jgi:hypothetical protein